MSGAGVALLIAAAGAGILLLEHWRYGRQLERERRAGLHRDACDVCGYLDHNETCPERGRS